MVGPCTGTLPSDPYPVDREIDNLIFDGLVRYDEARQRRAGIGQGGLS